MRYYIYVKYHDGIHSISEPPKDIDDYEATKVYAIEHFPAAMIIQVMEVSKVQIMNPYHWYTPQ